MTNKELASNVGNMLYGIKYSDDRLVMHSGGVLQRWEEYREYLRRIIKRKRNCCKCVKGHVGCALIEGGPCRVDVISHLAKHDESMTEKEMEGNSSSEEIRAAIKLFRVYYKGGGMPKPIQVAVELLEYVTKDVEELERQLELIAH